MGKNYHNFMSEKQMEEFLMIDDRERITYLEDDSDKSSWVIDSCKVVEVAEEYGYSALYVDEKEYEGNVFIYTKILAEQFIVK